MLFWLLYPLSEAIVQTILIRKGWNPHYLTLFLLRGIAAILYGALILNVTPYYEGVIALGWMISSFYVIFDILLNLLRGHEWNYKGSEPKGSGWLDSLQYKYYYILKGLSLICAFVFYVKGLEIWII